MVAMLDPAFIYVGSDKYLAITQWAALTAKSAGNMVRQLAAPTLGSERIWICTTAGTTGATEPAWNTSKGTNTPDGTASWREITGQPAVCGDATNTFGWTAAAKSKTVSLGQIIKRDNGVSYQVCTAAGTAGSGAEPSFSDTAGVTTTDNTVTWTSIGVVGNFSAFQAPHSRILNAESSSWANNAGTTIFISNAHAESQTTALTFAGGALGSIAAPFKYLCVSNSVVPPVAVTTGATVTYSGSGNPIAINSNGKSSYWNGVSFIGAAGGTGFTQIALQNLASFTGFLVMENCSYSLTTNQITSSISVGTSGGAGVGGIILINPTFVFGATAQAFVVFVGPKIRIIGGTFALTGTAPDNAIKASGIVDLGIRDMDFSGVTNTLTSLTSTAQGKIEFDNCRLASGVTPGAGGTYPSYELLLHNCDNSTKNYRFYQNNYYATVQQETTIYNTAGATDGTTRESWNIATTANSQFFTPYVTENIPIAEWQDAVGSAVTATVEIAGSATLTNADIWMEIEYLGSASYPLGFVKNNAALALATPSNVTSSSASWNGSPAVTQKLQVTFTPQMKGIIRARIYVAKPSITVYVDPLVTVV